MLGTEPLLLGDVVLAEVLQGFRRDSDYERARDLLTAFEVRSVLDERMALKSAQNFRALRRRGVTVRTTIGSVIATYCIEHGLWLLHADRDFRPFEKYLGLRVARGS